MADNETANTAASEDEPSPARYIEAIDRYTKNTQEWRERCEKIIKIYLDQHRTQASPRRFALLWANIETLKPAVYARLPVAVVSRRYKDQDPVARKASEALERCINTSFDLYGFDEVMRHVRDDRLLCSRGQAWVRYEADFEQSEAPDKETSAEGTAERVAGERVCIDHVHWSDFGHSMNRTWREVTLVWRKVYMTRAKVKARGWEKYVDKLNFDVRPEYAMREGMMDTKEAYEPQAIIYEIWDKEKKCAIWLAKDESIVLDSGDPPLNFRNFFPCPEPTYGTKATGALIPTPDYRYYQDQAEEIDDLTQKIADLTSWLRLRGFYAGGPSSEGSDAISELLKLEGNQVFVKVESWAGFAEKGGAKGLIEWLPLDMVVTALREAVTARKQLIEDVYQIAGISDILRGESDPNETLGAQEIKAQTGSRRISTTQRDIARFARDIAEMVGEVISEVFQPETITAMSGMDLATQPPPELMMQMQQAQMAAQANPQAQQAVQQLQGQLQQYATNAQVLSLLRDERTRGFRIEIETDSTIEPDEQAEKQRRVEFLETVGTFVEQTAPLLQQMPVLAPLVGEMLMFMVRGFRAGRQMEDIIEQTMQQVTAQLSQPKPNPEMEMAQQKLQMEQAGSQQKLAFEEQKHQQNMAFEREKHQADMQMKGQELQANIIEKQADRQMAAQQHAEKLNASVKEHQISADVKREMVKSPHSPTISFDANKAVESLLPTMKQHMEGSQEVMTSAVQGLAQAAASLERVAEVMAADSEIVRDKAGRAVRSRKVLPQRALQ